MLCPVRSAGEPEPPEAGIHAKPAWEMASFISPLKSRPRSPHLLSCEVFQQHTISQITAGWLSHLDSEPTAPIDFAASRESSSHTPPSRPLRFRSRCLLRRVGHLLLACAEIILFAASTFGCESSADAYFDVTGIRRNGRRHDGHAYRKQFSFRRDGDLWRNGG